MAWDERITPERGDKRYTPQGPVAPTQAQSPVQPAGPARSAVGNALAGKGTVPGGSVVPGGRTASSGTRPATTPTNTTTTTTPTALTPPPGYAAGQFVNRHPGAPGGVVPLAPARSATPAATPAATPQAGAQPTMPQQNGFPAMPQDPMSAMVMAQVLLPWMMAQTYSEEEPLRNIGMMVQMMKMMEMYRGGALTRDDEYAERAKQQQAWPDKLAALGISQGTADGMDLQNRPDLMDDAVRAEQEAGSAAQRAKEEWMRANGVTAEKTKGGYEYFTRNGQFFAGQDAYNKKYGSYTDPSLDARQRQIFMDAGNGFLRQKQLRDQGIDPATWQNPPL